MIDMKRMMTMPLMTMVAMIMIVDEYDSIDDDSNMVMLAKVSRLMSLTR